MTRFDQVTLGQIRHNIITRDAKKHMALAFAKRFSVALGK
jgi:hypothetical protein